MTESHVPGLSFFLDVAEPPTVRSHVVCTPATVGDVAFGQGTQAQRTTTEEAVHETSDCSSRMPRRRPRTRPCGFRPGAGCEGDDRGPVRPGHVGGSEHLRR